MDENERAFMDMISCLIGGIGIGTAIGFYLSKLSMNYKKQKAKQ